jgi:hypothetical protein
VPFEQTEKFQIYARQLLKSFFKAEEYLKNSQFREIENLPLIPELERNLYLEGKVSNREILELIESMPNYINRMSGIFFRDQDIILKKIESVQLKFEELLEIFFQRTKYIESKTHLFSKFQFFNFLKETKNYFLKFELKDFFLNCFDSVGRLVHFPASAIHPYGLRTIDQLFSLLVDWKGENTLLQKLKLFILEKPSRRRIIDSKNIGAIKNWYVVNTVVNYLGFRNASISALLQNRKYVSSLKRNRFGSESSGTLFTDLNVDYLDDLLENSKHQRYPFVSYSVPRIRLAFNKNYYYSPYSSFNAFNFSKFHLHNILLSKNSSFKISDNKFSAGFKGFAKFRKFQKAHLKSFLYKRNFVDNFSAHLSKESLLKLNLSYNKTLHSVDRLQTNVFSQKFADAIVNDLSKEQSFNNRNSAIFTLPRYPSIASRFFAFFKKFNHHMFFF